MSTEHYVIYGFADTGYPAFMCAPEHVELQLEFDRSAGDNPVHLVSIVAPGWDDAKEVYDALWRQL